MNNNMQRENAISEIEFKKSLFLAKSLSEDGQINLRQTILYGEDNEDPSCSHCSQKFCNIKNLARHTLYQHIMTGIENEKFYCLHCNFVSTDEMMLKIHEEDNHNNFTFLYRCVLKKCLMLTPTMDPMLDHVKRDHCNDIFICTDKKCFKAFCSKSLLDLHHKTAHQDVDDNGRSSKSSSVAKIRQTSMHYNCNFCSRSLNSSIEVRYHTAGCHPEKLSRKCVHCGLKFFDMVNLSRHKCPMLKAENKEMQLDILKRIMNSDDGKRTLLYDAKILSEKKFLIEQDILERNSLTVEQIQQSSPLQLLAHDIDVSELSTDESEIDEAHIPLVELQATCDNFTVYKKEPENA